MDIDVVGGRSVEAGEVLAGGAASVRGSEIDIKYADVKMSELFPLESDEMPALEPPPAEFPIAQSHVILYGEKSNLDYRGGSFDTTRGGLKHVLKNRPNVTHLYIQCDWKGNCPKNLEILRKFKHLQKMTIREYGLSSSLPKEFATSPCPQLVFEGCFFTRGRDKYGSVLYDKVFARVLAKNKYIQSLALDACQFDSEFLQIILRESKSITTLNIENTKSYLRGDDLLPSILQNMNLFEFQLNSYYEIFTNKQQAQIDAHLLENRQRRMVFPVLAAMQLTQSRDKNAIVDLLPQISRLLGDPPISRQRAVQIVNQIEPMVGGKRKTVEAKPLPFMFTS